MVDVVLIACVLVPGFVVTAARTPKLADLVVGSVREAQAASLRFARR